MSQVKATYITGDDLNIPIQLATVDGNGTSTPFALSPTATVRAALIENQNIVAGPVTIVDTDPGNDWPNGVVVAVFASTDTANLTPQKQYEIEVETKDPSVQTFKVRYVAFEWGYIP